MTGQSTAPSRPALEKRVLEAETNSWNGLNEGPGHMVRANPNARMAGKNS
jgi:hypothetical protein